MARELLMGNEAIGLGAIRAGVSLVAGYPGTPSTEILETVAKHNQDGAIHVEWSVNEKAALEVAAGASYAGARTLVTMKQVGLNVASDPLMSLALSLIHISKETAVLRSANMSMGINLLLKLLRDASRVLAPAGFDIEIVERHHNQKLDAPSGTALALADAVNDSLDNAYHYVYDRSQVRQKREAKEIGISAVRGGTIVGDHEVIYAGTDEVIEFKHTAYSRAVFARGAVEAAKFLAGKPAGRYDMADVIEAQ